MSNVPKTAELAAIIEECRKGALRSPTLLVNAAHIIWDLRQRVAELEKEVITLQNAKRGAQFGHILRSKRSKDNE